MIVIKYLVPVFWVAANNKWDPFDSERSLQNTLDWFKFVQSSFAGNDEAWVEDHLGGVYT